MLKLSILCSIPLRPATPDLELHNGRQVGPAAAVTQSGILYSPARHGGKLLGKYPVQGNSCGPAAVWLPDRRAVVMWRCSVTDLVTGRESRGAVREQSPQPGAATVLTIVSSEPALLHRRGHKLIVEEIQIAGVFRVLLFTFRWTVTVVDDHR